MTQHTAPHQIGQPCRLFAPLADAHGRTGTVIKLSPPDEPRTATVQLDGSDETLLVHVSALRPVPEPLSPGVSASSCEAAQDAQVPAA